jgi:hypothetical protein
MRHIALSRARAVAASAYLFTYRLVMNYRDMYRQAVDPSSSVFSGGFGTWRHRVDREPRTGGSGRPHEDVLHSSIWLDLRSEPWLCTVGEVPPGLSFVWRRGPRHR